MEENSQKLNLYKHSSFLKNRVESTLNPIFALLMMLYNKMMFYATYLSYLILPCCKNARGPSFTNVKEALAFTKSVETRRKSEINCLA